MLKECKENLEGRIECAYDVRLGGGPLVRGGGRVGGAQPSDAGDASALSTAFSGIQVRVLSECPSLSGRAPDLWSVLRLGTCRTNLPKDCEGYGQRYDESESSLSILDLTL